MKKLIFLLMVSLIVVFTTELVSAQGNKTQDCFSFEGWQWSPCMDEAAYGTTEVCYTLWDGKWQTRVKGEWVGESGAIYTLSVVENIKWKDYVYGQAYNYSGVGTASLECDGVPFAVTKIRYKITVNANGEVVVDRFDMEDWTCL